MLILCSDIFLLCDTVDKTLHIVTLPYRKSEQERKDLNQGNKQSLWFKFQYFGFGKTFPFVVSVVICRPGII